MAFSHEHYIITCRRPLLRALNSSQLIGPLFEAVVQLLAEHSLSVPLPVYLFFQLLCVVVVLRRKETD